MSWAARVADITRACSAARSLGLYWASQGVYSYPSMNTVRIGVVGDFDRGKHSHWATEAALFHAAAKLGVKVEPRWVETPRAAEADHARTLSAFDGIWGAPGSPYRSMAGILNAIRFARERDIPYLGTCAGFQYALIEFTRNVLGIADADSAENDPEARHIVITPIACPPPVARPLLSGSGAARPVPGTSFALLCGNDRLTGEYFCSFETNPAFVSRWEAAGLRVAACGADGEMRAFEVPGRRFFLATLFQPQLASSFDRPHPAVVGFLQACATPSQ